MQKLYNIVKVMLIFALLFTQNNLQAQKRCVECQTDVKIISDKQVLLERINLKAGILTTNININLYVSYRSGNSQKFWTNLVIATAGVAVSTQLNNANLAEGKSANGISPLLPLGVSVATLPSIWKNRPRGIPQAGLWIQHRNTRGKLLETWEQPISNEAKNDAQLLTVSIDKPLTAGTLEVYLQNGSKNGVYYWGYGTTSKSTKPIFQNPVVSSSIAGCPDGYLPNGNGMCCNPFTGECMIEGGGTPPPPNPNPTPPPTGGGCPSGYLPNGQGMCCNPFTGDCVSEGGGTPPPPNPTPNPTPPPTGGGCPDGYLPNGNGMCCNPFTGHCVNEGSVPPTTQQIYSGEWRCTAGLVPTDGGNCLNTSNGDIIAPVFVVNPQDPGPFPNECPIGSKEVIVKDDNGNSTKSCIGGIELGQVTVTAPRLNPLIPITPYPTVTYQPVVISRGGGGTGGGTGGTGTGKTDPENRDPVKKARECKECKERQLNKLNADLTDAETNFYLNCATCLGLSSGGYAVGRQAGRWISGTEEGGVSGSLMLTFLIAVPCLYQMNINYQRQRVKAYDDWIDNINNNCNQYCK